MKEKHVVLFFFFILIKLTRINYDSFYTNSLLPRDIQTALKQKIHHYYK